MEMNSMKIRMTDLDRLLEIDDEVERIGYQMKELDSNSQRYKELDEIYNAKSQEKLSLKSQLESKLAESKRLHCPRCHESKNCRYMLDGLIICDKCNFVFTPEESLEAELKQIQSQHTNLVKAIQDRINKPTKISGHIHEHGMSRIGRKCKYCEQEKLESLVEKQVKQELQNLLESTKKKSNGTS